MKDIGLWGEKIRAAYAQMGILGSQVASSFTA
jgi:hypothetical protein